jgi:16S rRNA pseudouridine516 synthase
MQLQEVLFSQGFGTRRVCAGLIQQGLVQYRQAGQEQFQAVEGLQPATEVEPQGLLFRVQGVEWPYAEKAYLMLHKPAGTECSQKPSTWPSIYTLLPAPLRQRPQKGAVQGVQAVGRLDQDTTGLLLLTDDGKFIHRMSSPRHHVPKVYDVTVKHALDGTQVRRLLEGVVLDDDPKPVGCGRLRRWWTADALAPDPHRRQIPPGQAHAGGGRQPGRGTCTAPASGSSRCRPTWPLASGAGFMAATDLAAISA